MKKYMHKFSRKRALNISVCVISFLIIILQFLVTDFVMQRSKIFSNLYMTSWRHFTNPFIIAFALSFFNLFANLKIKSRMINYISSLSLLVYIFTENDFMRNCVKPEYWRFIYNAYTYEKLLLWNLALAGVLFIGGIIISTIYKVTLQKILYRIAKIVSSRSEVLIEKCVDKIAKIK